MEKNEANQRFLMDLRQKKLFRLLSLSISVACILLFNGCVAIFKGSVQKDVSITTGEQDPDTKVQVQKEHTEELESDSSKGRLVTDLSRKHYLYQVTLSKEGYLDAHHVLYKNRLSFGTFMLLALGAYPGLTIPYAFDGKGHYYKVRDFPPENQFEPPKYQIPNGERFEKELAFRGLQWDLEDGDTLHRFYHEPSDYYEKVDPENIQTKGDVKRIADASDEEDPTTYGGDLFRESFQNLFAKRGFLDTNDHPMVLNDHSRYYLTSEIMDLDGHFFPVHFYKWVSSRGGFSDNEVWGGELFEVDLKVRWKMKNNFGELIFDTVTTGHSGEFCYEYIPEKAPPHTNFVARKSNLQRMYPELKEKKSSTRRRRRFDQAVLRALKASWIASMEAPTVQRALYKDTEKEIREKYADLDAIHLKAPVKDSFPGGIKKQKKSVVTVDRKEGHGSGSIVSEDGYILTNYHVISAEKEGGSDSVEVLFHDDSKKMAEVVRTNRMTDLALLKVDTTRLPALRIDEQGKARVGSYVYAVGTPTSRSLAQTVTRGIVSGHRSFNGVHYIQADVGINPGNSGGALIDESSGELVGVPSVKLVGPDVEGVGFSVSGRSVMDGLKLRYQEE